MWWERLRRFERTEVDYAGTTYFVESPNFQEHSSTRQVRFVVIHITGGNRLSSAVNEFLSRTRTKSAHYIVDRDGTIVQMVRENNTAAHCANLETAHNRLSIGIEHVCSSHSQITDIQYQRSAHLVKSLCTRHNIPIEHNTTPLAPGIRGHTEEFRSSTHTGCPNSVWNWDSYINLVNSAV